MRAILNDKQALLDITFEVIFVRMECGGRLCVPERGDGVRARSGGPVRGADCWHVREVAYKFKGSGLTFVILIFFSIRASFGQL